MEHKLALAFNGADMVRIYEASKARGLSMEDWAEAIVSAAAADVAQQGRRLKAERDEVRSEGVKNDG